MPHPASRIIRCRARVAPHPPKCDPACGLLFHCTVVRNALVKTGDPVAGLRGDLRALPPSGLNHDQAVQVGPDSVGVHISKVLRCAECPAAARLDSDVVLVYGLVEVVVATFESLGLLDGEGLDHGLVQLRLVALEGQHIVGAPVADGLCNPLLAAHGVHGHDATLQRQRLEQCRDGRNLVGPVVHLALA